MLLPFTLFSLRVSILLQSKVMLHEQLNFTNWGLVQHKPGIRVIQKLYEARDHTRRCVPPGYSDNNNKLSSVHLIVKIVDGQQMASNRFSVQ